MAVLAVAAGVAGALSGAHPTGTPGLDPLYAGLFAAVVTLACSRSARGPCLILAAVAVGMSRGLLLVPAAVAFVVALSTVFARRRRRRTGALVGALAAPVILRWPDVGFTGLTALIAAAAVIPCLVSAFVKLSGRKRGLALRATLGLAGLAVVLSIPAVVGAFLARSPLEHAVSEARGALAGAGGGKAASISKLTAAGGELGAAEARVGAWWSEPSRLVPLVAQQRQALARTAASARALTVEARSEASAIDVHDLGYRDGHIDVAAIESLAPPLRSLTDHLASTASVLAQVRSPWLLPPISSRLDTLGTEIGKAEHSALLASEAVSDAPGLLGETTPRHYFVAFMTPSESRGLDGFIGSFGILTVDKGTLKLTRAAPIEALEPPLQAHPAIFTGLGGFMARYGRFQPGKFPQDLTYSPDFPTVAKAISEMYPQAGGTPVDGVMALDPYTLGTLLDYTGPIDVPGLAQPLTAANAASFLLKDQYETFGNSSAQNLLRHDYLQAALRAAFAKVGSVRLPGVRELSASLDPLVRQGRLLFWSDHPDEDPLLEGLHLAGRFPSAGGGDLLAVTTQNAGNNKMDSFLHRETTDAVKYDPGNGKVTSQVTVTLRNDAPSSGPTVFTTDPAVPNLHLAPGTNYTWLSVYSPLGLAGATVDGRPGGMAAAQELGVNVYSTYVAVPSGGSVTLVLDLEGRVAPGGYSVALRQQPLVNEPHTTVRVSPTGGWQASGPSSWQSGPDETQQRTFHFAS